MNLTTIGRIVFGLTIAFFGVGHLTNASAMSGMIPSFLSGMAVPLVYVTGICLIAAAISFVINRYTYYSGILMAIFLIIIVITVHLPGLSDPARAQMAMSMTIKDTAMAAGALMIAGMGKKS
ncbi:MAG TPA: DoxX family membrane protein [Chitinophagales bacterium]|nr:DoxX family membrane protein [Chitinophagales bacterium]